jgi:hypothetical protein
MRSAATARPPRGGGRAGGPAKLSKTDKQPYLPREDAERLLRDALAQYRREHRHLSARVVVHKTSRFTEGEITGLEAAADADQVDVLELVTVGPSSTCFFNPAPLPAVPGHPRRARRAFADALHDRQHSVL